MIVSQTFLYKTPLRLGLKNLKEIFIQKISLSLDPDPDADPNQDLIKMLHPDPDPD
jgi:hypothetical protein